MNEHILVVDDDPEIVNAIAITLEREGWQVLKAYNGIEALDHALNPEVRLILIDVMMPKLDGLSALIRIRERRNLPVIVLSAKSEDDNADGTVNAYDAAGNKTGTVTAEEAAAAAEGVTHIEVE